MRKEKAPGSGIPRAEGSTKNMGLGGFLALAVTGIEP